MSLATKAFAGFDIDGHSVRIVVTDASVIVDAAAAARSALDSSFDVFCADRDGSELQRVNRSFGRTVAVSPAMAEYVRGALSGLEADSYRHIEFDGSTIRLSQWSALALEATALPTAVERVAASVARRFGCGVMVTLDDHVAIAGPEPVRGWQVPAATSAA
ncbi:MAG: hypothetical protein WA931_06660 [Rhodococcus sp. (in: high G+C Gram-positive bacteria)]